MLEELERSRGHQEKEQQQQKEQEHELVVRNAQSCSIVGDVTAFLHGKYGIGEQES